MPREGAFHHLIIVSYPRQDKRSKGNGCAIQHDFMLLTVRLCPALLCRSCHSHSLTLLSVITSSSNFCTEDPLGGHKTPYNADHCGLSDTLKVNVARKLQRKFQIRYHQMKIT
ncbi:hypothetical protein TNIN_370021 [Trichonephila inaurata madagascariensis]|uniref:Uncharacterized protein n=1 Tax=Trichonephila inaurata madagascariensis TaxID=2747483 RepID=A0A8X6X7J6_9ARAC|nr:hypothetical protein TNIN_370021 [Trichonephila inaurata madagascariensis]